MILVSEIGDKTFLIAAILAMRNSRLVVFCGAMLALGIMTLLAGLLGAWLPRLLSRQATAIISIVSFGFFGIKLLRDGCLMDDANAIEELSDVQQEITAKEKDAVVLNDQSSDRTHSFCKKWTIDMVQAVVNPVFLLCFCSVFLAEWGDRSQFATIALAASMGAAPVMVGAFLGHAVCTCLAVISGQIIAAHISMKVVTLASGAIFFGFAILDAVFLYYDKPL